MNQLKHTSPMSNNWMKELIFYDAKEYDAWKVIRNIQKYVIHKAQYVARF